MASYVCLEGRAHSALRERPGWCRRGRQPSCLARCRLANFELKNERNSIDGRLQEWAVPGLRPEESKHRRATPLHYLPSVGGA